MQFDERQLDTIAHGVEEWIAQHAVVALPSAASPAAKGAISITIPSYLQGLTAYTSDGLEEKTQVADYPLARDIPALYRRCPQKVGAIKALQEGQPCYLFDDSPRCPGGHTLPELRERPLRIGASVKEADPGGLYVLFLDTEGTVQAGLPEDCGLDGRLFFHTEWSLPPPHGSPPWADMGRDGRTTIWPELAIPDRSFVEPMRRAQWLISNELTAQFIEMDAGAGDSRVEIRWLVQPILNPYLGALVSAPADNAIPNGWTITQSRQRQALLLALQAAVPQHLGPISITLGGLFDPDDPNPAPLLEASLSGWEYSLTTIQLAWRLLQPRRGGQFDDEELTLDGLIAMHLLVQSMHMHPCFTDMLKAYIRLLHESRTQQALSREAAAGPVQFTLCRRLLHSSMDQALNLRLWQEQGFWTQLGPFSRSIGDDGLCTGHEFFFDQKVVEDCVGRLLIGRHQMRSSIFLARLYWLTEDLLNSSLLAPASAIADLDSEAERLLREYEQWSLEAFDHARIEAGAQHDPEAAARIHGKWAFLFSPRFLSDFADDGLANHAAVSADLVVAALSARVEQLASPNASPPNGLSDVQCTRLQLTLGRWRTFRAGLQKRKLAPRPPRHSQAWHDAPGYSHMMTSRYGAASRFEQP